MSTTAIVTNFQALLCAFCARYNISVITPAYASGHKPAYVVRDGQRLTNDATRAFIEQLHCLLGQLPNSAYVRALSATEIDEVLTRIMEDRDAPARCFPNHLSAVAH